MKETYKVLPLFREDKLYSCLISQGEYALDWTAVGRTQGSVQRDNHLFDSLMKVMGTYYQLSWGAALNQHFAHLLGLTDYVVPAGGKPQPTLFDDLHEGEWIDSDGFANSPEDYRYVD